MKNVASLTPLLVSQVALDAVTEEFTSLLQYKLSEVEKSILKLDLCETTEIKLAFQSPTLVDPFYSLLGKYQQVAYFQECLVFRYSA